MILLKAQHRRRQAGRSGFPGRCYFIRTGDNREYNPQPVCHGCGEDAMTKGACLATKLHVGSMLCHQKAALRGVYEVPRLQRCCGEGGERRISGSEAPHLWGHSGRFLPSIRTREFRFVGYTLVYLVGRLRGPRRNTRGHTRLWIVGVVDGRDV